MSNDIQEALEYVREFIEFSDDLLEDDSDLRQMRRVETLLMKLERHEADLAKSLLSKSLGDFSQSPANDAADMASKQSYEHVYRELINWCDEIDKDIEKMSAADGTENFCRGRAFENKRLRNYFGDWLKEEVRNIDNASQTQAGRKAPYGDDDG